MGSEMCIRDSDEVDPTMTKEELKKIKEDANLTKDRRTIFVSQLTMKVNEDTLREFFGQMGKVNNVIMLRDKNTNKHKPINMNVINGDELLGLSSEIGKNINFPHIPRIQLHHDENL